MVPVLLTAAQDPAVLTDQGRRTEVQVHRAPMAVRDREARTEAPDREARTVRPVRRLPAVLLPLRKPPRTRSLSRNY